MRIWSLHPQYLDAKGLVALWRETLLAKNVLLGLTKGYKNHPQLNRFKETADPVAAINQYLGEVYAEALRRGYNFNKEKFDASHVPSIIKVTCGQVAYERQHLLKKLLVRDRARYETFFQDDTTELHPLFEMTEGGIEDWEVL